jgi:hypothetical protein
VPESDECWHLITAVIAHHFLLGAVVNSAVELGGVAKEAPLRPLRQAEIDVLVAERGNWVTSCSFFMHALPHSHDAIVLWRDV